MKWNSYSAQPISCWRLIMEHPLTTNFLCKDTLNFLEFMKNLDAFPLVYRSNLVVWIFDRIIPTMLPSPHLFTLHFFFRETLLYYTKQLLNHRFFPIKPLSSPLKIPLPPQILPLPILFQITLFLDRIRIQSRIGFLNQFLPNPVVLPKQNFIAFPYPPSTIFIE